MSSWHAQKVLECGDLDQAAELKYFVINVIHRLPFKLPSSPNDQKALEQLVIANYRQINYGRRHEIKLPDVEDCKIAQFLHQQFSQLNPPCEIIKRGENLEIDYMVRVHFFDGPGFKIYFHKFLNSDPKDFHDHLRRYACSVHLSGAGKELILLDFASGQFIEYVRQPGTVSILTKGDFHRLVIDQDSSLEHWTMFICDGEKSGGWGFRKEAPGELHVHEGKKYPFHRYVMFDDGNNNSSHSQKTAYPKYKELFK